MTQLYYFYSVFFNRMNSGRQTSEFNLSTYLNVTKQVKKLDLSGGVLFLSLHVCSAPWKSKKGNYSCGRESEFWEQIDLKGRSVSP